MQHSMCVDQQWLQKKSMKHLRVTEGDTGAKIITRPYNRCAHNFHVKLALHVTKLATAETLQES